MFSVIFRLISFWTVARLFLGFPSSANILGFPSAIILSDIYSEILLAILSSMLSGILSGVSSGPGALHSSGTDIMRS